MSPPKTAPILLGCADAGVPADATEPFATRHG
jgi:hypothetical protein